MGDILVGESKTYRHFVQTKKINSIESKVSKTAENLPAPFLPIEAQMSTKVLQQAPVDFGNFEKKFQVSPTTGRSLINSVVDAQVIWGGKLPGDVYGSIDIKGARADESLTGVFDNENTPSGFSTYGFKDNLGIELIKQASYKFRQLGLPTEYPSRSRRIYDMPDSASPDNIPILFMKPIFLLKYAVENWKSPLKILKAGKYLLTNSFWLQERYLQVSTRLKDLTIVKNDNQFWELMNPVFRWLNSATKMRGSGLISGTPPPEVFKENSVLDAEKYFSEWIPEQMGVYIGRLHKNHITHGFPHSQNWSAVATLYDLDSIWGVAEDDSPPESTYEDDLKYINEIFDELFGTSGASFLVGRDDLKIKAKQLFMEKYETEKAA